MGSTIMNCPIFSEIATVIASLESDCVSLRRLRLEARGNGAGRALAIFHSVRKYDNVSADAASAFGGVYYA